MNKILVDAFGGDNSPEEIIKGAVNAVKLKNGFVVTLVGKQDKINELLNNETYQKDRIEVLNADKVITCEEEPTKAIMKKPNSSLCVAFKELKENADAKGFISAGSTGAVLVGATLKLGRIKGINRPALCPTLPTLVDGKNVLLLDCGANADCKPINLVQFALMGSIYAKTMGVENPKIALLSNGTEDEKGNALNHQVFPILKEMKEINFVGNCEARDILTGNYDVIVSDGFSGNVALKSLEGGIMALLKLMKKSLMSSFRTKIGGLLIKPAIKEIRKTMDYNNNGGALFVGVDKAIIKAHGSAKAITIQNAILQCVQYAELGLVDKLKDTIQSIDFSNIVTE